MARRRYKHNPATKNENKLDSASDKGEGEGENSDSDRDADENSSDQPKKEMSDDEIVAEAKAVYNKEMIDTFLNGYLSMLYLLANVAQIESIPR